MGEREVGKSIDWVMFSQVYAYVETHQIVHIKCVFLSINYTLLKAVKKKNLVSKVMICHPTDNRKLSILSILLMQFTKETPSKGF